MAISFGSYVSEEDIEEFGIPNRYLIPIERRFIPMGLTSRFMGIPYLWEGGGTSDLDMIA